MNIFYQINRLYFDNNDKLNVDFYIKMSIICEYCKTDFKNNYSLKYHQKNAQYCLEIQGKKQDKFIWYATGFGVKLLIALFDHI